MDLISIITPVHNKEKYLGECIKSILSQTYTNFELIIVDDYSTDDSLKVVNSFSDERIKIIKNSENRGAAYSRNVALKEAKGDYIAFIDGDDIWDKEKLESQHSFMVDNGYAFSYTNYQRIEMGAKKKSFLITGPKKVNHRMFIKSDYVGCLTVMYKRDVYPNLQIPNDIYKRNDYALWLKLSQKVDCYLLDKCLSFYRVNDSGISNISKNKLVKYHVIMFKKTLGYNWVHAYCCALRNIFYYVVRKIVYRKRIKPYEAK